MSKEIIVVGAFQETIELCEEVGFVVIGIIDNHLEGTFCGIPIIGTDKDAGRLHKEYPSCGIVISPDAPRLKERLMELYKNAGFYFPTIISPLAHVSKSATIAEGVLIQAGVNISSNTKIGRMAKLNYNVNVMHDVLIEDYCVLAPNVILLGRAKVFSSSYIGANSIILPDTSISSQSNVKPCSILSNNGSKE